MPTGLVAKLRINTRALWTDEGGLIGQMSRYVKNRLREMPVNASLGDIERCVVDETRKCCKMYNNKRPEVIVMAYDMMTAPEGERGEGGRGRGRQGRQGGGRGGRGGGGDGREGGRMPSRAASAGGGGQGRE